MRPGACDGLRARHAEALEVDEAAHLLRPHARIEHRDVAAHAVAEQVDRRARARRTARRGRSRGRPGIRERSRCRPAGVSLAPKPRQSSASTWRSSARASTTNWNEAATSIQPCSITSVGRSSRVRLAIAPFEQVLAQPARVDEEAARAPARTIGLGTHVGTVSGVRSAARSALRQRRRRDGRRCQNRRHGASNHLQRRPRPRASRSAPAEPADVAAIVRLIHGLAEFEKLTHLVQVTPESLAPAPVRRAPGRRGAGRRARRPRRRLRALLHQLLDLPRPARASISRTCSSSPRSAAAASARRLLEHLARLAATRGCGRFEWSVLDWNEGAIRFYQRMGATVMPDWRICRIAGAGARRVRAIAAAWLTPVDRYAALHAGFRWHVPARLQHRRGLLHALGARDAPTRWRSASRPRTARAPTSATAQLDREADRLAAALRTLGVGARRSRRARPAAALRDRGRRTSRSIASARSRCRCRCCSVPMRSSTASTTARRGWPSSTRAASPT